MNISNVGYTRCPGCLCHVKVEDSSQACPFCGEALTAAETLGARALDKLRGSRSSLVAMGLAGGVTFAIACSGVTGPGPGDPGNDYGGFDPGETNNYNISDGPDMGSDSGSDVGTEADVGPESDGGVDGG